MFNVLVSVCVAVVLSYVGIRRTHSLELESPDDVGGELLRVGQRDGHDPVALCASRRPVLITLHPAPLFKLRQHDNRRRPLLPNHPPEIGECLRKGTL